MSGNRDKQRLQHLSDVYDSMANAIEHFSGEGHDAWTRAWKWGWRMLDHLPTMSRRERRLLILVLALVCIGARREERRKLPTESVN